MTDFALSWLLTIIRASWQGSFAILFVWIVCRNMATLSTKMKVQLLRLSYFGFIGGSMIQPINLPILPVKGVTGASGVPFGMISIERYLGPVALILLVLWGAGAVLAVSQMLLRILASMKMSREWKPIDDHRYRYISWLCRRICNRMGITRVPKLMTSDNGSPAIFGFICPTIVIPYPLIFNCSQHELELIVAHELAHFRRSDLIWSTIASLLNALFFFIPMLKWVSKELTLTQEINADYEAVTATGSAPFEYGALLVRISIKSSSDSTGLLTAAMSSIDSLKMRLSQLGTCREAGIFSTCASVVITVCLIMAMLPITFTQKAQPIASLANLPIDNGVYSSTLNGTKYNKFIYRQSDNGTRRYRVFIKRVVR